LFFFVRAEIERVGHIIDHPAECVKGGDIAPPLGSERDKCESQIGFTLARDLGCVHNRSN